MKRAFVAAFLLFMLVAGSAAAQQQGTGIQATGTGTASAPAQTAHLQILLGSGASFGMAPVEFIPGTPGSEMPMDGPMGMGRLSSEQLDPVVEAITGTGIASDAIEVTIPAYTSMFGPGGPEIAQVRATIDQPQSGALVELVSAVTAAAQQAGLSVLHVGARYEAVDCVALLQQAREAAIADAQLRAEGLARGLGVTLGELVQAGEYPYFGVTGTDSCAPAGTQGAFGPYGPGTDPAFDPDATEATVAVQVMLTYAIEEAA